MKPIEFKEQNIVFAEHQDEYLNLPARKFPGGETVTCHKMTWKERLHVLWTGKVWSLQLTFNQPLQPIRFETDKWKIMDKEYFRNEKSND